MAINEEFFPIAITDDFNLSSINHQQLLSSGVSNLKRRIFITISSHEPTVNRNKITSPHQDTNDQRQHDYEFLLNDLKVLDHDQWSSTKSFGYGELKLLDEH